MLVVSGLVVFEGIEQAIWETLLQQKIKEISPQLLRELADARVKKLFNEGSQIFARMATQHIATIPVSLH